MELLERITDRLAAAAALDGVGKTLTGVVSRATAATPVKNALSGTWLGHQAHPLLTDVPIGTWLSAGLLDLFGGKGSRRAAQRLAGIGILAALPTAATGASDWAETYGGEKRIGLVHAASNSVALLAWTASWQARRRGNHASGRVLGGVGLTALGVGGFLGGHLSYRLAIGVDRTATEHRPGNWVDLGAFDELPDGAAVRREAGGVPVVLVREGDRVHALSATCTHAGGPLDEGEIANGCVRCPWHGSRFRLSTGDVERGPASSPQPRWQAMVGDGRVSVRWTGSSERSLPS